MKIARERLFFLSLLATEFPLRERESKGKRETAREGGKTRREREREKVRTGERGRDKKKEEEEK